ncbi:MAG: hypothetical protein JXQ68_08055 [Campylobacterales bacterium]|nr:hypothetical protein [Campylobacterales bacterium]
MKKEETKNIEEIPGLIETIPADEAELLGAFVEDAISEEDALEAIEQVEE